MKQTFGKVTDEHPSQTMKQFIEEDLHNDPYATNRENLSQADKR